MSKNNSKRPKGKMVEIEGIRYLLIDGKIYRYADLTLDKGFKIVLGRPGSEEVLKHLLNRLLGLRIVRLEYRNTEHPGMTEDDRASRFDVYCEDETGTGFQVEMQNWSQKHFHKRAVYYSSLVLQDQAARARREQKILTEGKKQWDYNYHPLFVVSFLNYKNWTPLNSSLRTNEFISTYRYLDIETKEELGDGTNLVFIDLHGFRKNIEDCKSLEDVTFGENSRLTSIGASAFSGCKGLTNLVIPDSVTTIGDYAFSGWKNLTSIVIGNGLTSIGTSVFYSCSSLTEITLPFVGESRSATGYQAVFGYIFGYTTSSKSSESGATYQYYNSSASSSKKYYHYYIPTSLRKVTITSATSIGREVFYNCSNLTEMVISDSVTSIGMCAFDNCTNLKSVYYMGTEEEWSVISVDFSNGYLTNATRYYYSESEPVESGNYWHYNANGEIEIWT